MPMLRVEASRLFHDPKRLEMFITRIAHAFHLPLSQAASNVYHPRFASFSSSPIVPQLMPTIASPRSMLTSISTLGSL